MPTRTTNHVTRSLIVRVVDGRAGRRIVVHDVRSNDVRAFATWEAALAFARARTEAEGLR